MRIRPTHSMQTGKSLDSSNLVNSQNLQSPQIPTMMGSSFNGSANSLSHHSTETNTQAKHVSPQLSKCDGYLSPGLIHNDHGEESNTTYLKPDFYDPLVLTKCDPVCPSPLAMLAKTCQNIGQMMEASVHSSHSSLSPTNVPHVTSAGANTNGIATTRNSLPTTAIASASNNASGITQHLSPVNPVSKSPKHSKGSSPATETKGVTSAKRSSMSRFKWMRTDPNESLTNNSHRVEAVSSSTSPTDFIPTTVLDGITSGQKLLCTIPNSLLPNTLPLNGCLTADETSGSTAFRDTTEGKNQQPTSNALAQLARLSSSLSLPDPPRSVNGVVDGLSKDRGNWNDPLRVQTGTKRFRRNSGTGFKGFPLVPNSLSGGSKRAARDSHAHSQSVGENQHNGVNVPLSQAKPSVANASLYSNVSVRSSPQVDQSSSPNDPHTSTNPWFALSEFLQHMMDQKTDQTSRASAQDAFSYNLARSFLEFFYSRMVMLANGSAGVALPDVQLIPPAKITSPNAPSPNFFKDSLFSSHSSALNRTQNSNIPTGSPFSAGYTEPISSAYPSYSGERCCFCGHTCVSQAEWCLHMYTHFSQIEKGQNTHHPQNQHQNPSPVQQQQQQQQQQQSPMPLSLDLSDRIRDFSLSKFTSLPFPFSFPTASSNSSAISSLVGLPDPLSHQKPDGDYMCTVNSYLASWVEKYKDMNGVKPSSSHPPTFSDVMSNPLLHHNNPTSVDCSSARPDFQMPKFADPNMYMYWIYLYAAYYGGNMPSRAGYSAPQQSPSLVPQCPSSNTMGLPHSLMSAFGMTGPGLGIFPKV
ncbi:hypothetical protein FGIG_01800 [Fasciola gigantica]|uniref:Uncharacterized protein n=1 Tax=Fasciola gigantica TaxID=46835 RepID=A0A504YFV3_FASGI|nr:hypothetical protein FGIG_01800 [Fasciola gigantica]